MDSQCDGGVGCGVKAVVLTVDDDGPADYSVIWQAINAAGSGDTVMVKAGTYNENINLDHKKGADPFNFLEVAAKEAARDCGAKEENKPNTRQMCKEVWSRK